MEVSLQTSTPSRSPKASPRQKKVITRKFKTEPQRAAASAALIADHG